MSLRLVVLSWWTPKYIIRRELDHVSDLTTAALTSLLATHAPAPLVEIAREDVRPSRTIEEKRTTMAKKHTTLVKVLEDATGRARAIEMGREALFEVGKKLGKEARDKLGVGDEPRDLIRAARIMYRVLGITFEVEQISSANAKLIVDRCALSKGYSELTCLVLSATDEGVVRGLNPGAQMRFEERMTSGCAKCVATVQFNREGDGN